MSGSSSESDERTAVLIANRAGEDQDEVDQLPGKDDDQPQAASQRNEDERLQQDGDPEPGLSGVEAVPSVPKKKQSKAAVVLLFAGPIGTKLVTARLLTTVIGGGGAR
jgi:hypothetical protein